MINDFKKASEGNIKFQGPSWSSGQYAALYSNDPSSNPRRSLQQFFCKTVVEKNETKQKGAGVGPFLKNPQIGFIKRDLSTTFSASQTSKWDLRARILTNVQAEWSILASFGPLGFYQWANQM